MYNVRDTKPHWTGTQANIALSSSPLTSSRVVTRWHSVSPSNRCSRLSQTNTKRRVCCLRLAQDVCPDVDRLPARKAIDPPPVVQLKVEESRIHDQRYVLHPFMLVPSSKLTIDQAQLDRESVHIHDRHASQPRDRSNKRRTRTRSRKSSSRTHGLFAEQAERCA